MVPLESSRAAPRVASRRLAGDVLPAYKCEDPAMRERRSWWRTVTGTFTWRSAALALLPLAACAKALPVVTAESQGTAPLAPAAAARAASIDAPAIPTVEAVADGGARTLAATDAAVTFGAGPVGVARRAPEPSIAVCAKGERRALAFEHAPIYTDKVERDGEFSARLYVGHAAKCTRRVALPLSFTPPKTTATRTVDFVAYVPPGGAFVEMKLDARDLTEANVAPGRYAITFDVRDDDGARVGRALSGNPFRRGRDDVQIATPPKMATRIGAHDDLVIPMAIENRGDTANRVTPLVVFTRPGTTTGIEHYDAPLLVVPGTASYTLRLTREQREAKKIGAGSWLVTVTTFDSAGDRMNSFAGLPLTIGTIDMRVARPELPVRLADHALLRVVFKLGNRGDTSDQISAVVAFTKPGTTASHEFVFKKDVPPGATAFEAIVDTAKRKERGIGKGAWLMTTAAFTSSGERIKSFTGHYLEIVE